MPVASLPEGKLIGNFLSASKKFIDQLSDLGVNYWQVLPLGKTDQYGCPYASPSAFGLSHLLIDESALGLELRGPLTDRIDYEELEITKKQLLLKYALEESIKESAQARIAEFKNTYYWAHDMGIFLTLKDEFGADWTDWPAIYKDFSLAQEYVTGQKREYYNALLLLEVIAHEQWFETMAYAHSKGIEIIGDVPIFVSRYSFDSWRWPSLFKVEKKSGTPLVITGAPPDDFSSAGQLWGTLNYRWQEAKEEVINWWSERISYLLKQFDILRIDHFIGLYHVWESHGEAIDASEGQWVRSEGEALLERLKTDHPHMPFIAEDLGALSAEVTALREKFSLPSMKVFQFSIGDNPHNEHLPQNQKQENLLYSATHDNNTMWGWIEAERTHNEKFLGQLSSLLGIKDIDSISKEQLKSTLLHTILNSKARTCVFQLQDIMGLGESARVNVPGTIEGNWNWKMKSEEWDILAANEFSKLLHLTNRTKK